MLKYYSSYIFLFAGLSHIFCCGLPLFLSVNTLFTNILFSESIALNFNWFEAAEVYLFVFSSLILFLLITSEIYERRVKCSTNNCCTEIQCDSKKKTIKLNIILSSVLYTFNSVFFLSEKFL